MTQHWIEATILVARDEAEAWADASLEAGALSVQAEDADADSADEQPQFGEPAPPGAPVAAEAGPRFGWRHTRLGILLEGRVDPAGFVSRVAQELGRPAAPIVAVSQVADRDWVSATQSQFEAMPVGRRLLVLPSWRLEEAGGRDDDRVPIVIDPGVAFGTGSHPTTHLCLEWLDAAELAGKRVIDYGCGSGILAIAAARLGAAEVSGRDIDPQALASAAENARANGVAIDIASSSTPPPPPADVVLANILSNPLKLLAPLLSSLVAPGGSLVLAGVLERQADEVADCYRHGVPVAPWRSRDGWVCLVGRRAGAHRFAQ
ncbi:MAG: 50S ribosomal protein L11 methyltransferase [Burkholderiaceae bacterium]|nr:50S ribosomal protein L11 methyltransferase [Burkholderiaceae bacterium]